MKNEQPGSKQAKRQYWQEHVENWKRSGLSQEKGIYFFKIGEGMISSK